ncbi:MAG: antitoxin Xre/MbcA/ParS toxin-binding domain-containing protein [Planctomycetota bacterium]
MADPAKKRTRPRAPHWYAVFLGLSTFDAASLEERVLEGFAYETVLRLQDEIDLTLGELAELVQIPPRTMARRRGEGRLHPDESDRVLRAARILGRASELFEGDLEAARRWLGTPNPALGGRTPLSYARTEIGSREVERLIGRIEHGVAS